MNDDELMRLRDEQVALQTDRGVIRNQIDTERRALETFTNLLVARQHDLPRDWLVIETARLRRIAELLQRGEEIDKKVHPRGRA